MHPRSQGTWVEARDRPAGENQMKLDRMIGNISQVCRFGDMSDDTANPRLLSIGYKYPKTPPASSHPPKAAKRKRLVDIRQCLPYFFIILITQSP
jgi:hypothetical protein